MGEGLGRPGPTPLQHTILSLALAQPSEQDAAFNTSLPSDGLEAFGVSHGTDQGASRQSRQPAKAASPQTVPPPCGRGTALVREREGAAGMVPLPQCLPSPLPPLFSIIQGACSRNSPPVC